MRTKRERWGGKGYVNVTRDDQGRIKTWAKWSPVNKPASKSYTSQGFARRNYARGIAERVEGKQITRGSVNRPRGEEINEYTVTVEVEGKKGKRSPARIKELRFTTEDEIKDESTLIETLRELARSDKRTAAWIERYDQLSGALTGGSKLRESFNAGVTTDRYKGVRLS